MLSKAMWELLYLDTVRLDEVDIDVRILDGGAEFIKVCVALSFHGFSPRCRRGAG
jgi:hypothetical protein